MNNRQYKQRLRRKLVEKQKHMLFHTWLELVLRYANHDILVWEEVTCNGRRLGEYADKLMDENRDTYIFDKPTKEVVKLFLQKMEVLF